MKFCFRVLMKLSKMFVIKRGLVVLRAFKIYSLSNNNLAVIHRKEKKKKKESAFLRDLESG